jgi:hypothetical protein
MGWTRNASTSTCHRHLRSPRSTDPLQRPATEPPAGHHGARRRSDQPTINSVKIFLSFSRDFASYRYRHNCRPITTPARHLTHDAVIVHADLIRGGYGQSCELWYVNFSKAKFVCSSAIVFADLMGIRMFKGRVRSAQVGTDRATCGHTKNFLGKAQTFADSVGISRSCPFGTPAKHENGRYKLH